MNKVVTLIPIVKNRIFHDRGDGRRSEQTSPLPRVGRDEVSCTWLRPMFRSSHLASGAKAPLLSSFCGGAEAPPFRVTARRTPRSIPSSPSSPSRLIHHRHKIIEQIPCIMRPRRSLRMILHAEQRQRPVPHPLIRVIVQIHMRNLHVARRQRIWIHAKSMILRSDLHLLGAQVLHRMIRPMMPKF